MEITIGHTPDADDAFMFYGLFNNKVSSNNFTFNHIIEDIEKLNKRAIRSELDVTAISVNAYQYLSDYTILRSGGSFGIGYGPIIIASKQIKYNELNKITIAVPGKLTSAFMLLELMIGEFKFLEMDFDEIPQSVKDGKVDAGLVIHETQLSYQNEDLIKIADVGKWWDEKTRLPVPLGINVMKSKFDYNTIKKLDDCIKNSIMYGLSNVDETIKHIMKYGRGQSTELITKFVKMYVNNITIDMNNIGKNSIHRLFNLAQQKNILNKNVILYTV